MRKIVEELLRPGNTRIISLLGAYQLVTGVWLVMPWHALPQGYVTSQAEFIIGIVLLFIGSVTIFGSTKSKFRVLRIGTTSGFLFWFISTILLLFTNPGGVGWIACLIFAVYCLVVDLNVRVNYIKRQ